MGKKKRFKNEEQNAIQTIFIILEIDCLLWCLKYVYCSSCTMICEYLHTCNGTNCLSCLGIFLMSTENFLVYSLKT